MKILNLTLQTIINNRIHKINWPVPKVLAFTTTRLHPQEDSTYSQSHSFSPYGQFNLGEHVGDNLEQVRKNRDYLLNFLPENSKIQWLEQVHGNYVVIVDDYSATPIVADAVITKQKNITLAVMTADCLPILLSSADSSEIAAIHGGWKPLAKSIVSITLEKMQTSNREIYAWLGPCIGNKAFVVGAEVKDAFVKQGIEYQQAFAPYTKAKAKEKGLVKEVKYLANLPLIAKLQLNALGVKNIMHLDHCTFTNDDYYSFRRESKTGRMASLITIE